MSEAVKQQTGAEDIAWDLSDLYSGIDDPAIDTDLDDADAQATQLAADYKGRIADLDSEDLREFIDRYEKITQLAYRTNVYAYLHWSVNTEDPARGALLQKIRERTAGLEQTLVFWELEWANADEDKAKVLMADPTLMNYHHWLEVARIRKPHLLSEPEEKILSEKSVTGKQAWGRFMEAILSAARYEWEGEMVAQDVILNIASYHPDRDMRKKAMDVFTEGLKEISLQTTYVFNTLLADKASDDKLRGYPTWISARNQSNEVEDSAVEALVNAVTSRYDIVHRYYDLKRRMLGWDDLFEWDRYAMLPAADRPYMWDEAVDIVLASFDKFHPQLGEAGHKFFDNSWIDAPVRPGKSGGAYCYSIGGEDHPYLFLNFEGRPRDVTVLAHELGHGVHGVLSQPQGVLMADTPITTAETASVFGEMLVFDDLMKKEEDDAVRLAMLTSNLEDSFATVFRQIAMNRFEHYMHTARREEGELSTERFSELWLKANREMFGDALTITDDYGIWWSYVHPHFTNTPGYVYGYAFGQLLVLALYARYQEVGSDFADAYVSMLSAGGSNWPHELVKPMGIDLQDPNFWTQGLDILDNMVTQAEELAPSD